MGDTLDTLKNFGGFPLDSLKIPILCGMDIYRPLDIPPHWDIPVYLRHASSHVLHQEASRGASVDPRSWGYRSWGRKFSHQVAEGRKFAGFPPPKDSFEKQDWFSI